jgi:peptidoglycan/LPS O-acetylase OafA/YrhL
MVGVSARSRSRSTPHWRGLDGLRAIAVIAVVIYHFSPDTLPGGFLGVDVFFVISGYLITRLLTDEFLGRHRIDAAAFYRRRARRLLPALALLLAAVSTAALIWRDQLATIRGGVLSTAVFGGNWWLAFDHQPYFVATGRPSMLQHLWSLGVEEQFYLLWPLVAAATLAAGRRHAQHGDTAATEPSWTRDAVTRLCGLALVLSVASTVLTWWLAGRADVPYGNDGSLLYYGTDTHCMGLLLGAALGAWAARSARDYSGQTAGWVDRAAAQAQAALRRVPDPWHARAIEAFGVAALAALLVTMHQISSVSLTLYRGDFLLVSALVAAVIAVATRPGSGLGAALDAPVLRWIGVRSYGIYLWHWPITVVTRPGLDTSLPTWLDQLLRIALTLGLAAASYTYVETPVRRLGFRPAVSAAVSRVQAQWRRLPPRAGVAGPVALTALALVGVIVIIVGPAAPTPTAAAGSSPGGRSLAIGSPTTGGATAVGKRHRLPRISGYGDSVLLGAKHALGTVFPGGTIDAVIGRQPDPILTDAINDAHLHRQAPLVILDVGNNGLIKPSVLTQTMRALSGARLVIVFNDHLESADHPWQKPNNATLASIVPHYANATLVNWNAIASAHHDWLYPDDLHLTPTGTVSYAKLIAHTYRTVISSRTSG